MGLIVNRIKQIADNENIKITPFEESIGASKGVLSRAIKNKTDIQSKWISKVVENYPQYRAEWLLTGKGDMLKKERLPYVKENKKYGIPLIPVDAMAGFGTGGVQIMDYDTENYHVPEFTELHAEFMIRVKGSSMYPKYNSGDILACKKITMSFFQWNKVYVLDTEQGALIKRIKPSEKEDHICCVSDNKNYDPFDLHINEINAIALVLGVIRLE
ncbi:hypothetical protein GO491_03245 [Flavobacteriaceae bacterium Ap0902]|nr:hypothetical protein [Flavobacteriaceae bacterium Ap0902]